MLPFFALQPAAFPAGAPVAAVGNALPQQMADLMRLTSILMKRPGLQLELVKGMLEDAEVPRPCLHPRCCLALLEAD